MKLYIRLPLCLWPGILELSPSLQYSSLIVKELSWSICPLFRLLWAGLDKTLAFVKAHTDSNFVRHEIKQDNLHHTEFSLQAVSYFSLQNYSTRVNPRIPIHVRVALKPEKKNTRICTKESAVHLVSSISFNYCIIVCNLACWHKNWSDFKRKGRLSSSLY